jgi:predicted nucleic acid-binding protein
VILVDSSVWIAHLRGHRIPATDKLEAAAAQARLLIGGLILLAVLQGARSEWNAARIERALRAFPVVPLLDGKLATRAARNYRVLRAGESRFARTRYHYRHLLHRARAQAPAR